VDCYISYLNCELTKSEKGHPFYDDHRSKFKLSDVREFNWIPQWSCSCDPKEMRWF